MRVRLTRFLTTSVLLVSLLVPFASGWAVAMGVADGRVLVICTGDGLRMIYIDQNGDPTQISDETISCVLKSTVDTAQTTFAVPRIDRFDLVAELSFGTLQPKGDAAYLAALPRAPPMI